MSLTVEQHDELQPLSCAEWLDLFGGHPDPPELIALTGQSGTAGFLFKNIVVRDGSRPILSLPLFAGDYPIATTMDPPVQEILTCLERFLPLVLKPKILAVGFLEGERGQIGLARDVDEGLIASAWALALSALESLSRKLNVAANVFWNFTDETLAQIPAAVLLPYCQVASPPFCELALNYRTLDDYLCTLPKDMRRYLQRILRRPLPVRVEYARDLQAAVDSVYELYIAQVKRSQVKFGIQPKSYFENVCNQVPGASYMLYWLGDELIGFDLAVERRDRLVSKYFAMEPVRGRDNRLYFLSWLEQVRYCLERKLPALYLGGAAEGLKVKLGARPLAGIVAFHHRNPLVHHLLWRFRHEIAYDCELDLSASTPDPVLQSRVPARADLDASDLVTRSVR